MPLLLLLLLGVSQLVCADIRLVDDNGDELILAQPAQRIISLAPNITEVLFHIGAGAQIVGADEYSNYPEVAKMIQRVNNHAAANYELILSLKPDLVIAWQSGNGDKIINPLRKLGFPVFVVETREIDQIPDLFHRFGQLSGHEIKAQERIDEFTQRLSNLRNAQAGKSVVKTFYQIWHEPLITLNGQHMVSDIIRLCGGVNVFAEAIPLVPYINIESVVLADPEVIIAGGSEEDQLDWLGRWQQWTGISAVQNHHIYTIPSDLMQRHSDRILDGAEMMCNYFDQVRSRQSLN